MVEKWVKITLALITISIIVHWILFIIMMEKFKEPVTLMKLEEAKNIPDEIKDVYKNTFVPKLNALETFIFDKLKEGVVYANDDDDDDDEDEVHSIPAKKAIQIIAQNMKNNIDDKFCEISMGQVEGNINCVRGNVGNTWHLKNKEQTCADTWGADGEHWENVKYKFRSPFCAKRNFGPPGGVNPCNPEGFCWGNVCTSDIDTLRSPYHTLNLGLLDPILPTNMHHLLFACKENGNVSS